MVAEFTSAVECGAEVGRLVDEGFGGGRRRISDTTPAWGSASVGSLSTGAALYLLADLFGRADEAAGEVSGIADDRVSPASSAREVATR